MCGRLNMSLDPADLADELRLDVVSYDFAPRFNVPPGSFVPIVVERLDEDGQLHRRLETASWGLVPAVRTPRSRARASLERLRDQTAPLLPGQP